MKLKGPHLTLLVGLVLALILLILSANASKSATGSYGSSPAGNTGAAPTAPATSTPSPQKPASTAVPLAKGTFAGRVTGAGATVAIAVHNGKAIAYVCDGNRIEAWLQGSAVGGSLSLTGTNGSLNGSYSAKAATGSVVAGGRQWTFTVPLVKPPSGLYRATATIRNAKVIGGWIVLGDGTQVGVVSTDDQPAAAPPLDVSSGQAMINDATISAAPVDGESGL
jgi:hypothetical protein